MDNREEDLSFEVFAFVFYWKKYIFYEVGQEIAEQGT